MVIHDNDKVKKYDFKSNILLQPEELKIVKLIIESFGDMLTFSFAGQIKKKFQIEFVETFINKFGQILKEMEFPIIKCKIKVDENIISDFYIKIDNKIMICLIDAFLGGDLKNILITEQLTKIEEKLLLNIIDRMFKFFEKSISKYVNCQISIDEIIKKTENLETSSSDEQIGTIKMNLKIEDFSGNIILLIPTFILEKILKKNFRKNNEVLNYNKIEEKITKIKDLRLVCKAIIEVDKIKLKDIINIKPGDCIVFDYEVSKPVIIKFENVSKFLAMPGKIDKKVAMKIIKSYNPLEVQNG